MIFVVLSEKKSLFTIARACKSRSQERGWHGNTKKFNSYVFSGLELLMGLDRSTAVKGNGVGPK